ncbi:acyl-coenzyme A thioesterase 13-like [Acanthaster planci]|uniref:Acyl-coenzyme A thioesterase 13-like n=1 Tax=Acanthaster planci TaxID=133434 RepID=A0A8B7Y908_ACAPL|nr:acyl-coenzyme A thioesterase 13-like [Acanthaster planci]
MAASEAVLQTFRHLWKMTTSGRNYDRVLKSVNIVSVSPNRGSSRCELTVEEEHSNGQRTLHGGYMTMMVDTLTLATLAMQVGRIGVSAQLNMSFFRSADIGEKVSIDVDVIKAGKSTAFTQAHILNASGEILAWGTHIISLTKTRGLESLSQV